MAQFTPAGDSPSADTRIQNTTFPQAREDLNQNLEALQTLNSGDSEPGVPTAFMPWVKTITGQPDILYIRNSDNSGWIEIGTLDGAAFAPKGLTAIANGGTGATTAALAAAALLPDQTSNSDKFLKTNGNALEWAAAIASSFSRFDYSGSGNTVTHTWTKPSVGTIVIVLAWGSGGGGGQDSSSSDGGGGGGGGSCGILIKPLTYFTDSSYNVVVGKGGSAATGNSNGETGYNSSLQTTGGTVLVKGYGGERGYKGSGSSTRRGGNGGGLSARGSAYGKWVGPVFDNDYKGGDWLGSHATRDGAGCCGLGEAFHFDDDFIVAYRLAGSSTFGGGGGGAPTTGLYNKGGSSVFGGGGGGGSDEDSDGQDASMVTAGGFSVMGGKGGSGGGKSGSNSEEGQVPGGGGGGGDNYGETKKAKAGGHGRVEIYVF